MTKVCMVVQNPMVKGGIAAVVNGYRGSQLEKEYKIIYVESYNDGNKLSKLLKGIYSYFQFAKVLIINKPDIVHIHSSFGMSFYRKIPFIYMASWMRKPIINHIHGADFYKFYINASKKKKKKIKKIYGKCTMLIALSAEWKERLSLIVPADKIRIIENYSIFHEDALEERLNKECNNMVLFLGELGYRKGCYDIPEVTEKVLKEIPEVKFVLGGTGSPKDEAMIKKLFKDKGISDNVIFPGWVRGEQKDRLLREADVFFLPSYNEGMPMSVLDAMGYGLPIVGTDVGGVSKIVHDGENGYCYKPKDTDGFANGIIELLKDDKKRRNAMRESVSIVKKGYSLEFHLNMLEKVYEEVSL